MIATYVLHFNEPHGSYECYGDERHYVGFSVDFKRRLRQHRSGQGSTVTKDACEKGVRMRIGALFPNRNVENVITYHKMAKKLCRFCTNTPQTFELARLETQCPRPITKKQLLFGVSLQESHGSEDQD